MLVSKEILERINEKVLLISIVSAADGSRLRGKRVPKNATNSTRNLEEKSDDESLNLKFDWDILDFNNKELRIELTFENPKHISQSRSGIDKVDVMVQNQYVVQSDKMRLV